MDGIPATLLNKLTCLIWSISVTIIVSKPVCDRKPDHDDEPSWNQSQQPFPRINSCFMPYSHRFCSFTEEVKSVPSLFLEPLNHRCIPPVPWSIQRPTHWLGGGLHWLPAFTTGRTKISFILSLLTRRDLQSIWKSGQFRYTVIRFIQLPLLWSLRTACWWHHCKWEMN